MILLAQTKGSPRRRCTPGPVNRTRDAFVAELRAYAPADPHEAMMRDRFVAFVVNQPNAFERTLTIGHVTASTWIVDPSRARALLTHHRKLRRWIQLGGHVDGDVDVRRAALREACEESGLRSLRFASDAIYDVDIHPIPARGAEPAHDHYDVRFALQADPAEPLLMSSESNDLAWVPFEALARYGVDESVLRLARKTPLLGG